jgi:hypothetical protein
MLPRSLVSVYSALRVAVLILLEEITASTNATPIKNIKKSGAVPLVNAA